MFNLFAQQSILLAKHQNFILTTILGLLLGMKQWKQNIFTILWEF
jgi:hypothetical protein